MNRQHDLEGRVEKLERKLSELHDVIHAVAKTVLEIRGPDKAELMKLLAQPAVAGSGGR